MTVIGQPADPADRVAIVTVLYNSGPVLDDFLASLDAQTADGWALIAIDNASADRSADRVEAWDGPLHRVVRNPGNIGFAAATNQGIAIAREAGFGTVLLLNNDVTFDGDFLMRLLASPSRREAAMLAPVVRYHNDPARAWYAGGDFSWDRGALQAVMREGVPAGEAAWPAAFAPGCCLLVDITVFDRVGVFDPRFFVYWEDADFFWRCRTAGERLLVVREPSLLHKVSVLTEGERSPFSIRMYQTGQILFLRKHLGAVATWMHAPLIYAKALARRIAGKDGPAESYLRFAAITSALLRRQDGPGEAPAPSLRCETRS